MVNTLSLSDTDFPVVIMMMSIMMMDVYSMLPHLALVIPVMHTSPLYSALAVFSPAMRCIVSYKYHYKR